MIIEYISLDFPKINDINNFLLFESQIYGDVIYTQ
jgi:hypothetical protein